MWKAKGKRTKEKEKREESKKTYDPRGDCPIRWKINRRSIKMEESFEEILRCRQAIGKGV